MLHITNDKFYHLATLLSREQAFEYEDIIAMEHIMRCPDCSKKLKRAVAIVDSMDNIAFISLLTERVSKSPATNIEKAIIRIVVLDARSIIKQLESTTSQWQFDLPLGLGSKRSTRAGNVPIEKLEDCDNSKTFIAYDPARKVLAIQVVSKDEKVPSAKLKTPDGIIRAITFQRRGSVYWAEVHNLKQGEYELYLER